jgi:hypothetical protein
MLALELDLAALRLRHHHHVVILIIVRKYEAVEAAPSACEGRIL